MLDLCSVAAEQRLKMSYLMVDLGTMLCLVLHGCSERTDFLLRLGLFDLGACRTVYLLLSFQVFRYVI